MYFFTNMPKVDCVFPSFILVTVGFFCVLLLRRNAYTSDISLFFFRFVIFQNILKILKNMLHHKIGFLNVLCHYIQNIVKYYIFAHFLQERYKSKTWFLSYEYVNPTKNKNLVEWTHKNLKYFQKNEIHLQNIPFNNFLYKLFFTLIFRKFNSLSN